ncbi:magnesium transporter [Faunimonas pinastri]|uniref:Magnesium transport protein CorA n=1 Tax=Faunimonas pinastri TaxID=1855383 RepID=A0A1H9JJQ3_9HYPH|nr:magnesium transporter CorA family protein [Faunimonas pinastri]SEQ86755.1 magnesium transporter [Faunimonas pinastri]
MLNLYGTENGSLKRIDPGKPLPKDVVWADLFNPSREEERLLEEAFGIDIPTKEEMAEIEASSRLYSDKDSLFMTAVVLTGDNEHGLHPAPVTFILSGSTFVTVRYSDPSFIRAFTTRTKKSSAPVPASIPAPDAQAAGDAAGGGVPPNTEQLPIQPQPNGGGLAGGDTIFVSLLEMIVDRAADFIERINADVDQLSHRVFQHNTGSRPMKTRDFQALLHEIGRNGDLTSRTKESMFTVGRIVDYASASEVIQFPKQLRARLKTVARDVKSLADHCTFLSGKISFLLDATLGLISIEQNQIIKIFSVASVAFLPPTLIASIYGMNFKVMPELDWHFGYPLALCVMVVSAVLPCLYFKRRGWL